MSNQLPEDQWSLSSDAAYYRNWPVNLVIRSYFGDQDFNASGEVAFKKQLYQSMLGQALNHKTTIESWRASNVYGTTIWMFNELWPTGGWGSIEYGGNTTGQVSGGRWKPLQYLFRRSIYADQFATCNQLGACYVKNDAPVGMDLTVTVSLVNALTGKQAVVKSQDVSMDAGAGIVQWFCPGGNTTSSVTDAVLAAAAPSYIQHSDQIPLDRGSFTKVATGSAAVCESACNADRACLGYTRAGPNTGGDCWLYEKVPSLMNSPGDSWYQKPGTKPIPAAPPPPPPPPGTVPLPCVAWTAVPQWSTLGCDSSAATMGANCLLTVVVTTKGNNSAVLSTNELPFQPPKQMRIPPKPVVTAQVGALDPSTGRVPITLQAKDTALYVTLTTLVAGRFSDNAFLLLPTTTGGDHGASVHVADNREAIQRFATAADGSTILEFIPWGEFGEAEAKLLESSLRVEHLAENL